MGLSNDRERHFRPEGAGKQNRLHLTTARYQQIALDLAGVIAEGKYKTGDHLYAKSSVATKYGVSCETARRALNVLADLGVVTIVKGSGVTVISPDKAAEYVRQLSAATTVSALWSRLEEERRIQNENRERIDQILHEIEESMPHDGQTDPFVPHWIEVGSDCTQLGKTLQELNFWHNTLATVVAVRRGDRLMLSPGPYAELRSGDILYFVGDADSVQRVKLLLNP